MAKLKKILLKIIPSSLWLFYHKVLALLGAFIYRHPSHYLKVIGITGTDGKTTTNYFLTAILEKAGFRVASSSTISFKLGERVFKNTTDTTMPGRFFLQKFLKEALKEKVDYAIVETTSEGIAQFRHLGIEYDVAVLTNLSPEHLNVHKTFEAYREVKGKLFASLSQYPKPGVEKVIVVNHDDENADYFLSFPADKKIVYSLKPIAYTGDLITVLGGDIRLSEKGSSFVLSVEEQEIRINLKIPGRFNIYNALAAAAVAYSQGVDLVSIKKGLEAVSYLPGRMEEIKEGQDFHVFVDFAHTPQAMAALYQTLKEIYPTSRLIAVFGSAGGRDAQKRPILGEVAGQLVDFSVLTSDDPRDEDPAQIAAEIEKGLVKMGREKGRDYTFIADRRQAVRHAFGQAQKNDVVVLASMGHYEVMYVGQGKIPWSDKKVAQEELRNLLKFQKR